uniref:ARHGAP20 PH domain-containing protein n=2 Tax=Callorhinchus milii TaxID=7868 RepID=A0A4W3ITF0_CALMI
MEDCVQLTVGMKTKERHLFLFSDMLVIAKSKSASSFRLKRRINMCELWTALCTEEISEVCVDQERSIVIGWPIINCVVTFK